MNKYFLVALSILSLLSFDLKAQNVYIPYVGIEALYATLKTSQNKPHYFGASFNLGTMYNPYFGTELF